MTELSSTSDPSDDTAAAVRQRGHWHAIIRPAVFNANLLKFQDLESIMAKASVQLRGWDVPHIDTGGGRRSGQTWIQHSVNWAHHIEVWRLFLSGQFVHLKGFTQDWRDQSDFWPLPEGGTDGQKTLGITDTVWTFGEYFELASRLALALPVDRVVIRLRLGGLSGRELRVEERDRMPLLQPRRTSMESYDTGDMELTTDELVSSGRDLAATQAAELFARFGWTPGEGVLRDSLDGLFRGR